MATNSNGATAVEMTEESLRRESSLTQDIEGEQAEEPRV